MANTVKIKRSSVQGKVPTTGDLQLGELAVNTYDGKLYTKKDNGTQTIIEIGSDGNNATLGVITELPKAIISENIVLSAGFNGLSIGPVEISAGYAVTVPTDATWVIL
jgi:hypothetical protein